MLAPRPKQTNKIKHLILRPEILLSAYSCGVNCSRSELVSVEFAGMVKRGPSHNLAKLPFEISVSLSCKWLRPAYGQGFSIAWLPKGNCYSSVAQEQEGDGNGMR
jgi:hypothetical protein